MPRETFLPYSPPSIGSEEIDEVSATLSSDWITTGPRTKAFELQFGAYVGAPASTSLMLNSCTAGLHVALVAHGIGPGDEGEGLGMDREDPTQLFPGTGVGEIGGAVIGVVLRVRLDHAEVEFALTHGVQIEHRPAGRFRP